MAASKLVAVYWLPLSEASRWIRPRATVCSEGYFHRSATLHVLVRRASQRKWALRSSYPNPRLCQSGRIVHTSNAWFHDLFTDCEDYVECVETSKANKSDALSPSPRRPSSSTKTSTFHLVLVLPEALVRGFTVCHPPGLDAFTSLQC
ncbi:hypothetical protein CPB83DRAFT_846115 [Crepidotus variabilis]|uniref:Uncharacterized protein n=1 Tax=Crepidotus variabilis TaxID=179855 RepID=A0A9P6ENY5_9AGAR|nr:hypothetical protein CPB83DRAFT_846115 [Crepidotus variabilis]